MSYFLESLLNIDDNNVSPIKEENIDFSSEYDELSAELDKEYYSFINENKYNSIIGSPIVFNEFLNDDNIIKKFINMCGNFIAKFVSLIQKVTVSLVRLATTSKQFVKMYEVEITKAARLGTVEYEGYNYTIAKEYQELSNSIKNYSSKIVYNTMNIIQDGNISNREDFVRGEILDIPSASEAESKKFIHKALRDYQEQPIKLKADDARYIMDTIINEKHYSNVANKVIDETKKIVEKQISDLESNKNLNSDIVNTCIQDMKICISCLNMLAKETMTALKEEFRECKKLATKMVKSVQDGKITNISVEWVPDVEEIKD